MKAVLQRVSRASVLVDEKAVGQIDRGILLLLGIEKGDLPAQVDRMIERVCQYRIFPDDQGKMNRSLIDIGGGLLIVSQFTLAADTQSGRRPSFGTAELPEQARALVDRAVFTARSLGVHTETGTFQADMKVTLENDGPVTFVFEG